VELSSRTQPRTGSRPSSRPSDPAPAAPRGIRTVIPRRSDQRPHDGRHAPFDRATYRGRNRVERLVDGLKQYRRVATRYEKRVAHYAAMLSVAAVALWSPADALR